MDLSLHHQQVAHSLRHVEATLERLVSALAHRPAWITVQGATNDHIAIQQACGAYSAINYAMDDEVGHSIVCLGVIGVSSEILKRTEAVNAAKLALKKICAPLHGIQVRVPIKGEDGPTKKISALRAILRNIQRSDLNLLAAYRKIPVLDAPPVSVTYTRANTRAVYRKSVEELLQLLVTIEGPRASADRAKLFALDPHETHLALVKERYQNMRANVVYSRLDSRGRGRIQIVAELPLMYAIGRRSEYPSVEFPADSSLGANQPARARQSELENTPFLQSFPVYRYAR